MQKEIEKILNEAYDLIWIKLQSNLNIGATMDEAIEACIKD